jgi:SAM-dependent methyltransferase
VAELDSQTGYWDAVAQEKRFTHPLHARWLDSVPRTAAVLDYGCGYGRTTSELARLGFGNLLGVDTSPGMIDRARRLHPDLRFAVPAAPPTVPCADGSFGAAVLFAVLTCVPEDRAQRRIVAELARLLEPGGLLLVSDLPLQDERRNQERYARFAGRYGTYGVFETGDGAVCRHHDEAWPASLLSEAGFTVRDRRRIAVATMNGREAAGVQFLARRNGEAASAPCE